MVPLWKEEKEDRLLHGPFNRTKLDLDTKTSISLMDLTQTRMQIRLDVYLFTYLLIFFLTFWRIKICNHEIDSKLNY